MAQTGRSRSVAGCDRAQARTGCAFQLVFPVSGRHAVRGSSAQSVAAAAIGESAVEGRAIHAAEPASDACHEAHGAGRRLDRGWRKRMPDPDRLARTVPGFGAISAAAVDRGGEPASSRIRARASNSRPGAGLWAIAAFSDDEAREQWSDPFARRAAAAGRFADLAASAPAAGAARRPRLSGDPKELAAPAESSGEPAWWMLSLFHPADHDAIDWQRGDYSLTTRGGRDRKPGGWGEAKKPTRMVAEGSVIVALDAAARRGDERRARGFSASGVSIRLRAGRGNSAGASGGGHEISHHVPHADADRRRPKTRAHRLHGVEGSRQRARPAADFPAARQRAAPGGYLAQLKKADRLDFASWGGFAQNFAGRRIPFEHASAIPRWEKARAGKSVHPDVRRVPWRPLCARDAIKGALRTGAVSDRWTEATMRDLAGASWCEDRVPRYPPCKAEEAVLGGAGSSRMRRSRPAIPARYSSGMKVYLLRVSTLVARGGGKYELGWKSRTRLRTIRGDRGQHADFRRNGIAGNQLRGRLAGRSVSDRAKLFQASNRYAAGSDLAHHKAYAEGRAFTSRARLRSWRSASPRSPVARTHACCRSAGAAGLLGKSAYLETAGRILSENSASNPDLSTGYPDRLAVSQDAPSGIRGQSTGELPWIRELLEVIVNE